MDVTTWMLSGTLKPAMCLASSDIIHLSEVKRDFFGDPVIHAPSEEAIWKEDVDMTIFSSMIKGVQRATLEVSKKQYQRYYAMDVDDNMMENLSSARTHNMDSEEVMGMFSANHVRAPYTTLLFTLSKI